MPVTLAALAGAAAVLTGGVVLYGVHGRRAQIFGRSVARGVGCGRRVALTFDDGPSPATLELADFLAEQGIRATFFVCGENVVRHRGVARELVERGHEVGNHTYSHRRLCPRLGWRMNLLTRAEVLDEMERGQAAISEDCGVSPRLFRAPYGMRWFGVGAAQRRLGLKGVMWTVMARDWAWDEGRVVRHVLESVRPGAVICLHDGRDTRPNPDVSVTLAAVRMLVPRLKEMGYGFDTVSGLLAGSAPVSGRSRPWATQPTAEGRSASHLGE